MIFLNIISIIFIIFLLFCVVSVLLSSLSMAPWLPSRKRDLPRIAKLAALKPGEIFYDLGCGDGRILFYLVKESKAKGIGIELSFTFFLICQIRKFFLKRKNLIFKWKNLFKEDIPQADLIYVFALPESLEKRLKLKFEKELKPGSRVISYSFKINGLEPKLVDQLEGRPPIYIYQF